MNTTKKNPKQLRLENTTKLLLTCRIGNDVHGVF